MRRRVERLESYLGGELPEEGSGVTWREERAALRDKITVSLGPRPSIRMNTHVHSVPQSYLYNVYSCRERVRKQHKN